ncbi:hypothetical protein H4J46_00425 [Colwellia sp. MB02u-6]|jgi:hypothetical protein|uniref:hypothetical protein n=1 Tax=Colwellia sp. MB02u-6 TaxID=2759824 RepID=UPI0015F4AEC8|nr:hypothetical protein [Colwellia sp. MB02u-6]MBA6326434.1 hypothetical protein [Colwellia sp. MB02u-6]
MQDSLTQLGSRRSFDEQIKRAMAKNILLTKYNVAGSLGLAFMNRADGVNRFFLRADQALYAQKF